MNGADKVSHNSRFDSVFPCKMEISLQRLRGTFEHDSVVGEGAERFREESDTTAGGHEAHDGMPPFRRAERAWPKAGARARVHHHL